MQTVKISGALLTEVIEQGLSLDRGIMQVSGIEVLRPGETRRFASVRNNCREQAVKGY